MKFRIESITFFIVILVLLFQPCIEQLKYIDEIVTIFSLGYIVAMVLRKKADKKLIGIMGIMMFMVFLGILGNCFNKIQSNSIAVLLDIESMFKSFICFIAFFMIFKNMKKEDKEQIINWLTIICKITVAVGCILAIVNLFYDINMYTDMSYGLRSFHFIFRRVGNFNNFCVRSLLILTLSLYTNRDNKYKWKDLIFIVMNIVLLISTLRTRAFASAIIYCFGYFYFIKCNRVRIKITHIIPILIIIVCIAIPKINYFFNSSPKARGVLLSYGIKTAVDYFPLGSGFATYGTSTSQKYDSELYQKYNFDNYFGLSKENGDFMTDNYWPAIMGELGFIGALAMLTMLIMIFIMIMKNTQENNVLRFGSIFVYITLLIASLVSSSFFSGMGLTAMILIAFTITLNYNDTSKNNLIKE